MKRFLLFATLFIISSLIVGCSIKKKKTASHSDNNNDTQQLILNEIEDATNDSILLAVKRAEEAMEQAEKERREDSIKNKSKIIEENKISASKEKIRDAYLRIVKDIASKEMEDYSYHHEYYLLDMNDDGIPELWTLTGCCEADTSLDAYIWDNGLRNIYSESGDHSSYHRGKNYLVRAYGLQGYGVIIKLWYNGKRIVDQLIHEEVDVYPYTEPEEPEIQFYNVSNLQPIYNAFD